AEQAERDRIAARPPQSEDVRPDVVSRGDQSSHAEQGEHPPAKCVQQPEDEGDVRYAPETDEHTGRCAANARCDLSARMGEIPHSGKCKRTARKRTGCEGGELAECSDDEPGHRLARPG